MSYHGGGSMHDMSSYVAVSGTPQNDTCYVFGLTPQEVRYLKVRDHNTYDPWLLGYVVFMQCGYMASMQRWCMASTQNGYVASLQHGYVASMQRGYVALMQHGYMASMQRGYVALIATWIRGFNATWMRVFTSTWQRAYVATVTKLGVFDCQGCYFCIWKGMVYCIPSLLPQDQ